MIRLSGKVKIENGLIKSGVIVRHLILPSHIDNTLAVLKVFSDNFKDSAFLSLMAQYVPINVESFPDINRRITPLEYKRALNALSDLISKTVSCRISKARPPRTFPIFNNFLHEKKD